MLFFARSSSAFASKSQCRNAPPLSPRSATAPQIPQPLSTSSKASNRPEAQSLMSWEIVPDLKPPPLPTPFASPSLRASRSPLPEEGSASWEVIDEDTSPPTPNTSLLHSPSNSSLASREIPHSDTVLTFDPERTPLSDFDTEAFPPHAHLFPSSPNGTWRNESLHGLIHPTAVDYTALSTKLRMLAEEASDDVAVRVNRAFNGRDVPAMHDKVMRVLPSVSMPDMREFERAVNASCKWMVEVLERSGTRSRGQRW